MAKYRNKNFASTQQIKSMKSTKTRNGFANNTFAPPPAKAFAEDF